MKFRGKMVQLTSIRLFAQLLNILQKSSKTLVLRIMPDKLMFILNDKNANGNTTGITGHTTGGSSSAWCDIPQEPYFSEYSMEGISEQDNEIYLEVSSDMLASSLSSLRSSQSVLTLKMKLTKKVVPCLTFEFETQTTNSTVTCVHDLPVTLVPRRSWGDFQDPDLPDFHVSLGMPEVKVIRRAIDRIKNLGPKLTVTMSKSGTMTFQAATYNVSCSVTFPDLRPFIVDNDDDITGELPDSADLNTDGREEQKFVVEVDMKSIQHLIPSDGSKPSNLIASMTDGRLLHWLFQYDEVSLQYAVPGISVH